MDLSDLQPIHDPTAPPDRAHTRSMAKQEKELLKNRKEIQIVIDNDVMQSSEDAIPGKRQEPEGASAKTPNKKKGSTTNKTKATNKSPWQQLAHSAVDLLKTTPKKKAQKLSKN